MPPLDFALLNARGDNAPVIVCRTPSAAMPTGVGATRFQFDLGGGAILDTLLLNRGDGGPLIVQYHGALDRQKYAPPRFERLATLKELGRTTLLIADPTILLHERLQLAWYTGWEGLDLPAFIGGVVRHLATVLGSSDVVHVGSSGGGFAALQVGPHTPGSMVLAMNPQTSIGRYRIEDQFMGVQRAYVQHVMPHLWTGPIEQLGWGSSWWHPMADRMSAVHRYGLPQPVRVHFVQNMNDHHHVEHHLKPFAESAGTWMGADELRVSEHDGPHAHVAPDDQRYRVSLEATLAWLQEGRSPAGDN